MSTGKETIIVHYHIGDHTPSVTDWGHAKAVENAAAEFGGKSLEVRVVSYFRILIEVDPEDKGVVIGNLLQIDGVRVPEKLTP
jgi:hypothetical protein